MDKKRILIALLIASVLIPAFCLVPCNNMAGLIGMLIFAGVGTWEFSGLLNAGGVKTSMKWGISRKSTSFKPW